MHSGLRNARLKGNIVIVSDVLRGIFKIKAISPLFDIDSNCCKEARTKEAGEGGSL